MKIIQLYPRGFCKGVSKAINLAKSTRLMNPNTTITILGELVHSTYVLEALKKYNIETLQTRGLSRSELLDSVQQGIVIFSAHGVSNQVKEKALQKGLQVIDASCEDVLSNQNLIKSFLSNDYTILYIGQENHPEVEAIMDIDPRRTHLITSVSMIDQIEIVNPKIFVTNQTTMSILDILKMITYIQKRFPTAVISDEICSATRQRQEAVLNAEQTDGIIILGDQKSNNTQMLSKIAKNKHYQKVITIQRVDELNSNDLDNLTSISVTAGASTPINIINEVNTFLNAYNQDKSVNPKDFLTAILI